MGESLKSETVKGVFWSGIEKIANGGIVFLANIILARLLTPKDFGLLAIMTIFVQISQTLIDSGFSNALIQKKDRSQKDYSTVFIFNVVLSISFYLILFFSAPLISDFFNDSKLVPLIRVIGLNLIIGSLVSVHKTRLTIELRFKLQSLISLIASIVSAIISIVMAYRGFGVWSLIVLTISNITLQCILINILIKWKPTIEFSQKSFLRLFSYSSKLLGASLIHLLYRNIYPIIIGKKFDSIELGFFNRADLFASYAPLTIGTVISRVSFPIFSRIQDDNIRLRKAYSKYIIFTSIAIFPMMVGLIILARPVTMLVLKEQWIPMVPMLQILCIDWMFDFLNSINLNVLYVKGRSDIALRNEILKKGLAIIIFIISLYWGIIGVCWGRVIYGLIAIYINSYYTKRLIGLSILDQIRDILNPLMYSLILGGFLYLISIIITNQLCLISLSVILGFIIYISILKIYNPSFFLEIGGIIRNIKR